MCVCPTFDKHFGVVFVTTSLLDLKIQCHENRPFLFCLSIYVIIFDNMFNKLSKIVRISLSFFNQTNYKIFIHFWDELFHLSLFGILY